MSFLSFVLQFCWFVSLSSVWEGSDLIAHGHPLSQLSEGQQAQECGLCLGQAKFLSLQWVFHITELYTAFLPRTSHKCRYFPALLPVSECSVSSTVKIMSNFQPSHVLSPWRYLWALALLPVSRGSAVVAIAVPSLTVQFQGSLLSSGSSLQAGIWKVGFQAGSSYKISNAAIHCYTHGRATEMNGFSGIHADFGELLEVKLFSSSATVLPLLQLLSPQHLHLPEARVQSGQGSSGAECCKSQWSDSSGPKYCRLKYNWRS